ncbi:hypothetical protein BDQ17DRAFT_1431825 [Cyathus striatus]|nr:hypothetical protein BDQ17DRAFT_1431825 [Cyathus striatus]
MAERPSTPAQEAAYRQLGYKNSEIEKYLGPGLTDKDLENACMESPAQVTPPGEHSQPAHSVSPSPFADSLSHPTTFSGNSFSLPGGFNSAINDSTLTKEPQTQNSKFGIPSIYQGHSLEDDNPQDSGPGDIMGCVLNALSPVAPGFSPKQGHPSKGTSECIGQLYEEMEKLVSIAAKELGITQQQVLSYGPNTLSRTDEQERMNNANASASNCCPSFKSAYPQYKEMMDMLVELTSLDENEKSTLCQQRKHILDYEGQLQQIVVKGAYLGFEGIHCIIGHNIDTDRDLTCLINSPAAEGFYEERLDLQQNEVQALDHILKITNEAGAGVGSTLRWKGLRDILVMCGLHCINWPYDIEFPTKSLAPGAKAIGIKELSKQKAVGFSQRIKNDNGLCIMKGNNEDEPIILTEIKSDNVHCLYAAGCSIVKEASELKLPFAIVPSVSSTQAASSDMTSGRHPTQPSRHLSAPKSQGVIHEEASSTLSIVIPSAPSKRTVKPRLITQPDVHFKSCAVTEKDILTTLSTPTYSSKNEHDAALCLRPLTRPLSTSSTPINSAKSPCPDLRPLTPPYSDCPMTASENEDNAAPSPKH